MIGGASALTAVALSHNNKKKETYSSNDDSDDDGSELSFNTSSEDGDRSSDSPQEEISGSESGSGKYFKANAVPQNVVCNYRQSNFYWFIPLLLSSLKSQL